MLLKRCSNKVEKLDDLHDADQFSNAVMPYHPSLSEEEAPYVNLDNAIACINK